MIVLTILPALLTVPAKGQAVDISVTKDSITINMNILFQENLTAFPLIDARLSMANSTSVVQPLIQPINSAIQNTVPGASVSSLTLHVKSFNASGTWTLEENYSMVIVGAMANTGSNIRSGLGFVSMNITQSLQLGNNEINAVGPTFLLPALQAKAAAYSNLQYFIDGSQTRNAVIPEQTTRTFWLLDFTWIPSVSSWTENNQVLAQSTEWSFNPPSPRYNLTLGLPTPEGPLLAKYVAIYQPSMEVTVPANAWVSGNTLYFDLPTPSEVAMGAIVAATLIIALGAFVTDRRLTGTFRGRKEKPSKSR